MKKLRARYQKPVDYLAERPNPVTSAFVGQFIAAHATGDPTAVDKLGDITAAAYLAAKKYWPHMTTEEKVCTNAMMYLFSGASEGDTAEPEPVAEPPAEPTPQIEGAK
jgi:hypothetical protein